jgi:hypothetical protein
VYKTISGMDGDNSESLSAAFSIWELNMLQQQKNDKLTTTVVLEAPPEGAVS